MNDILLIRHASTDLAGTFCGHSNPPVNQRGLTQIQTLVASIDLQPIDSIYSSDLRRAATTAQAIADSRKVPMHTTNGLREMNFGAWEGLSWQQIEQSNPVYAQRWTEEFPHLPAPDGETFAAFQTRVLHAIAQLPPPPSGKLTAIVTHAGVMRVVLAASTDCTEKQAWDRTRAYCSTFLCKRPSSYQKPLP